VVELGGEPLVATAARVEVHCTGQEGTEALAVIEHAKANCTVANSLRAGLPVSFSTQQG
jgi:organic hydroperoxide reductase OsmC/OhrA